MTGELRYPSSIYACARFEMCQGAVWYSRCRAVCVRVAVAWDGVGSSAAVAGRASRRASRARRGPSTVGGGTPARTRARAATAAASVYRIHAVCNELLTCGGKTV